MSTKYRIYTIALNIFLLEPTSGASTSLPSNKIFTTLKWVCSEIGNN